MKLQNILSAIFNIICCLSIARPSQGWLFIRRTSDKVCYSEHELGCFSTKPPFDNSGGLTPQAPSIVRVRFHRHTSPGTSQIFSLDTARLSMTNSYDPSSKTILIIHGYFEHTGRPWIQEMVSELLHKGERNVIVVDWSGGANNLNYLQCVANTRLVGATIATFLQELISLGGDPSTFHLIGFSLGAHVAGYAGQRLPGIGRITGLDPAGPNFEGYDPEVRLDPTDAVLVDVIHTDTAPTVGMGASDPQGTVDFYPNGGMNQPGCAVSMIDRVSAALLSFDFTSESIRRAIGCSHIRAVRLFIASINQSCAHSPSHCPTASHVYRDSCTPCQPGDCPEMGYNLDPRNLPEYPTLYRTEASETAPFC